MQHILTQGSRWLTRNSGLSDLTQSANRNRDAASFLLQEDTAEAVHRATLNSYGESDSKKLKQWE